MPLIKYIYGEDQKSELGLGVHKHVGEGMLTLLHRGRAGASEPANITDHCRFYPEKRGRRRRESINNRFITCATVHWLPHPLTVKRAAVRQTDRQTSFR